jgi:alpha-tubulin suppressor-like RCC1 family protein
MRVVVCVLVVAVLTSLCCGAGFFDEDEAERELIRETTLPFSEMFLGLRVEKVVTGGYFSAALLSNNSVLMQGCAFCCWSCFWSSFDLCYKGMGQPLRLLNGSFVDIGAGTYDLLAVEEGEVLHVLSLRDDGPAGQLRPLKSGVRAFCGGFEDFRIMLENRPAQLCCGSNYALQRTDDGRVLGTGSNAWGVLREGKVAL